MKMSNTSYELLFDPCAERYQREHNEAIRSPHGFERAAVDTCQALHRFAVEHQLAYDSPIGDDGVLGEHWKDMAKALIGMLNGQTGRLDCGKIDGWIRQMATDNNVNLD